MPDSFSRWRRFACRSFHTPDNVTESADRPFFRLPCGSDFNFACLSGERIAVFENNIEPLASRTVFFLRIFYSFLMTLLIVLVSLGLGTWGYHVYGGCTGSTPCLMPR